MAVSAPFSLSHLLSLLPLPLPLPRAATRPKPPPRNAPLLPLSPPSSPLPAPLSSFRTRLAIHGTTNGHAPVSILRPTHAEAPDEEKNGGFGWTEPLPPADVLFACHPAAALANVLFAKSGYYNTQVVVAEDEPEDRLVERFGRACARAGVFKESRRRRFFEDRHAELKRRAREAAVRRGREAARLRRIAGVAQIAGGFSPSLRQRGKKKKKKTNRPQLRETAIDEEEEEDNWELPEGEIPYCCYVHWGPTLVLLMPVGSRAVPVFARLRVPNFDREMPAPLECGKLVITPRAEGSSSH
ncbi:hypothetical protein Taro_036353 [Colocasia esculenta]|uniref:Ribosomal protein S21 n=1 Tax=Colocasia esculenta TaxID=4460 RepID=A0A843W876_COLES|nr:hypothetical protein [Colocasia esculenta]